MIDLTKLAADLQQRRDELKLQLHLASKDAEDEWHELMADWDKFLTKAQFEKSSEEVGEAARELGLKLKATYDRMKSAGD
jgi:DNA-binding NtrC family response regulator